MEANHVAQLHDFHRRALCGIVLGSSQCRSMMALCLFGTMALLRGLACHPLRRRFVFSRPLLEVLYT